jgi:hypothetical protein
MLLQFAIIFPHHTAPSAWSGRLPYSQLCYKHSVSEAWRIHRALNTLWRKSLVDEEYTIDVYCGICYRRFVTGTKLGTILFAPHPFLRSTGSPITLDLTIRVGEDISDPNSIVPPGRYDVLWYTAGMVPQTFSFGPYRCIGVMVITTMHELSHWKAR